MPVTDPQDMSRAYVAAIESGDLERLLTLYEPQVKYVGRSGKVVEGIAAIREGFQRLLALRPKLTIVNAYCIAHGDIALVRGDWRLVGTDADGKPVEMHGESAEVLRRQPDGSWRYAIDHAFGADPVT